VVGWCRSLEVPDYLGKARQDFSGDPGTIECTVDAARSDRDPTATSGCRRGQVSTGQLLTFSLVEEHAPAPRAKLDRDTPAVDRQEISAARLCAMELRYFHLGDVQFLERRMQSIPCGTLFLGFTQSAGVDPEPPATITSEDRPLIASTGMHRV
jgi:hypothetical protein